MPVVYVRPGHSRGDLESAVLEAAHAVGWSSFRGIEFQPRQSPDAGVTFAESSTLRDVPEDEFKPAELFIVPTGSGNPGAPAKNLVITRLGSAKYSNFFVRVPPESAWTAEDSAKFIREVTTWFLRVGPQPTGGSRQRIEALCSEIQFLVLENAGLKEVLDRALAEADDLRSRNRQLSEWLSAALDARLQVTQLESDVLALSIEAGQKTAFDGETAKARLSTVGGGLAALLAFVSSFGGGAASQLLPTRESRAPAAITQEQHQSLTIDLGNLVEECRELGGNPQLPPERRAPRGSAKR